MKEVRKMKEIIEIKEIKKKLIENINQLTRKAQTKTAILVLAFIGALILVGWVFMHSGAKESKDKENAKQQEVRMDGTTDSQFTQDASQKALEEQQVEIKELREKLVEVNDHMDFLQKTLDEKDQTEINDNKVAVQELQDKIAVLEVTLKKTGAPLNNGPGSGPNNLELGSSVRGITTTNFSYTDDNRNAGIGTSASMISIKAKTAKDYVPPGTFARAVLLSGADTNAGVHGQSDTIPITMRILDSGTLPNGEHSSLKGCFVTAAAYGDASSERGQIRLQRLSCVRKPNGHILDVPIEGTISDMGGSDGIRGHVVMRNNRLIWNAGVSGVLAGIGNAMQQSLTTQSVSPLGVTNSINPGKVFQYGAYGGANSALGKLAEYYIKLADMYHPIVQVHAGSEVNVVFLKGFSLFPLTEGQVNIEPSYAEKEKNSNNTQDGVSQSLMSSIKDSQLGQGVNVNDGVDTGDMQ